ncbi:hypothetical protein, partial [Plesiomonas shigelloides]|uniref:hypothetical protein n=1 Tax=Plesiomonas shigelloides TaxID=703 RepID=UPI001C49B06F
SGCAGSSPAPGTMQSSSAPNAEQQINHRKVVFLCLKISNLCASRQNIPSKAAKLTIFQSINQSIIVPRKINHSGYFPKMFPKMIFALFTFLNIFPVTNY